MRANRSRRAAHRTLALAVLALCVTLAGSGCYHHGSATGEPGSVVRAGIAPDFPPFAFTEGGHLTGIEPDFARKLGEQGITVTLVQMPWEQLIPALQDGKIDMIMSGMSITEDRVKKVDFTVPYVRIGQMAIVRRSDYDRLRTHAAADQSTVRVGFVRGTTSEKYARSHLTKAQLVPIETVEQGVAALRGNTIDLFVNDAPIVWRVTGPRSGNADLAGIYRPLSTEYIAWAVRRGADGDALRERLNEKLLEWQEQGEIDAVLDHWITVRKVTLQTR
jgi:ABC-type amino acid transport substrate-binding protein